MDRVTAHPPTGAAVRAALGPRPPSPLTPVEDDRLARVGVRVWLKRDDLVGTRVCAPSEASIDTVHVPSLGKVVDQNLYAILERLDDFRVFGQLRVAAVT